MRRPRVNYQPVENKYAVPLSSIVHNFIRAVHFTFVELFMHLHQQYIQIRHLGILQDKVVHDVIVHKSYVILQTQTHTHLCTDSFIRDPSA